MWPFRSALLIVSVQPFRAFITSRRAAAVSLGVGVTEGDESGVGVERGVGVPFGGVFMLPVETLALVLRLVVFEVIALRVVSVFAVVPPLFLNSSHAPSPPRPMSRIVATTVMATTEEVLRRPGAAAGAAKF